MSGVPVGCNHPLVSWCSEWHGGGVSQQLHLRVRGDRRRMWDGGIDRIAFLLGQSLEVSSKG